MSFEIKFKEYLENIKRATTEHSKSFQFLKFINDIFSESVEYTEDLFPYLEKYIKTEKGTVAKKGRTDALLGNIIIEFKKKLDKERLEQAKQQLQEYIYIIWSKEKHKVRYLLIASDGLKNIVYRPILSNGDIREENIRLEKLDEIDLKTVDPEFAYIWLDRYILYKELQIPTIEKFVDTFGKESPIYKQAIGILSDKWEKVKAKSNIEILFIEWGRYLEIVYGEKFGEDLFLRHTYLATISKFMAHMFYSDGIIPSPEKIISVISGEAFKEWGIQNLFENDFFSWILRAEKDFAIEFSKYLIEHLKSFDLTELKIDVLKGIYQELVDPEERHDLGEYYTPDWLADTIIQNKDMEKDFLDPACGSGTFLASIIKYKKNELDLKEEELINHILSSVVGIDIHPLAVITSRVNYLLALGKIIHYRQEDISIPVYFADSIRLPKYKISLPNEKVYSFAIDDISLDVPRKILHPKFLSRTLDFIKEIIENELEKKQFEIQIKNSIPEVEFKQGDLDILFLLAKKLNKLKEEGRDTIWIYILKNIYRPIYLTQNKFDYIVGNPPWLSYRYANKNYQTFIKEKVIDEYHLLAGSDSQLITHMELATLFFARTSDLYLKDKGIIEFIMPRGIFSADQYYNFRTGVFNPTMKFEYLVDLDEVKPLFNISSCYIRGIKGEINEYPISGAAFKGELPYKNVSLEVANKYLSKEKKQFFLNEAGARTFIATQKLPRLEKSYYKDKFSQGATLVPRNLWFVDIKKHPKLGFNPKIPYVETSKKATEYAKEKYKDIFMKGKIPREFLFATLRGSEIVPFTHLPFLVIVLPCLIKRDKYKMLYLEDIKNRNLNDLYKWVKEAEEKRNEIRGEKLKMSAIERLNRRNGIEGQKTNFRFKVLYLTSGTNIASCVIDFDKEKLIKKINGTEIPLEGFVASSKTYYFGTNNKSEAYYLMSFLNADYINNLLKNLQSKGLFGERDIHKKVLDIPIPKFNPGQKEHINLTELGKECYKKAYKLLPEVSEQYKSIAWIRKTIREKLSSEMNDISSIVKDIISSK